MPPSDAYVRSFLYLLYTLIKLYYTKAQRSSLVSGPGLNSSPPEAKNPASNHSATTFQGHTTGVTGRTHSGTSETSKTFSGNNDTPVKKKRLAW